MALLKMVTANFLTKKIAGTAITGRSEKERTALKSKDKGERVTPNLRSRKKCKGRK